MAQKTNPTILRRYVVGKNGVNLPDSIWFEDNNEKYKFKTLRDYVIRKYIQKNFKHASVSSVKIERINDRKMKITIFSAKPSMVFGKKGEDIAKLKTYVEEISDAEISISVSEIVKPDGDPALVAANLAAMLCRRLPAKRSMAKLADAAMKTGVVLGVKIVISGRIGGVDIARSEKVKRGIIPLHTIKADIRYGTAIAKTQYGIIGIKVWVVFSDRKKF